MICYVYNVILINTFLIKILLTSPSKKKLDYLKKEVAGLILYVMYRSLINKSFIALYNERFKLSVIKYSNLLALKRMIQK